MSSDARKKEKHRLKRKAKQQQLRKIQSRTALQRIAAEGGRLECWVSPVDWKQQGIASMQVLGHAPGGRTACSVFLVDLWAVGLKDAFGRGDVPELTFRENQLEPWIEQTGAIKLDPAVARRLVAGGVRFGRQNGFRMPPEWEKFVAIFGRHILDEIPNADLADFGIDGGLRYVGSMQFLERRLAMPTAEFLGRPDVHWVMGPDPGSTEMPAAGFGDDEMDEETMEHLQALRETTEKGATKIAGQVRDWCAARGREPIPILDQAARAMMFAMAPAIDRRMMGKQPTEEDFDNSERLTVVMLSQHPPAERKALETAITQIRECLTEMGREARAGTPPSDMEPTESSPSELSPAATPTTAATDDQSLERARS